MSRLRLSCFVPMEQAAYVQNAVDEIHDIQNLRDETVHPEEYFVLDVHTDTVRQVIEVLKLASQPDGALIDVELLQ